MNKRILKYNILLYLFIVPLSLFSQTDTTTQKKHTSPGYDSLYINNQLKSDRFYDSLKTKAAKNKITKTALNLILVNESTGGKFVGVEDLRNEEYFNLYRGKIIRNIDVFRLDVFGPTLTDTTYKAKKWIEKFGNNTHINTRKFIIKNNLFFSSGDTIDPVLLVDKRCIDTNRRNTWST